MQQRRQVTSLIICSCCFGKKESLGLRFGLLLYVSYWWPQITMFMSFWETCLSSFTSVPPFCEVLFTKEQLRVSVAPAVSCYDPPLGRHRYK